ncbi:TetR/AcrR family transcriptional regulator [Roseobacter sp. YSTF-M11]|uniref:TetR/AcrR family transcriptional regulator n=1 Tax=Roseobacter insulae TaxID=2859783 RepID=A0A9X1FWC2_9RHOB|nr:TetR/AcrR family transcriptional regulator [Roseobacter insulae]MBW4709250.1 TetR/AcrR family transcriptional regulator [Roseobacter insulae]
MDQTDITPGDDPEAPPLVGNIKVTRQDWLDAAREALIEHGVEGVKVQLLGEQLNVSRSSFYWYFKSRQDLLNALLDHWQQTNTAALIAKVEAPATTITEAVGNIFRCFVNPELFNTRLDFAIRDWARRSEDVKRVLRASEAERLEALRAMFVRFGYPDLEAIARARILYYMQIGYDDAQLDEPMEARSKLNASYILGFTGQEPSSDEVAAMAAYTREIEVRKLSKTGK